MLTTLVGVTLGVFFIWETLLSVVPWTIPAWLQPVLVYGASLGLTWPDWRIALAASGAVGLLHVMVRAQADIKAGKPSMVRRPGRSPSLPKLP